MRLPGRDAGHGPWFMTVTQPLVAALTGAVGGARLVMQGESFAGSL